MPDALPALGARIALVGLERVLLRRMGAFAPPTTCAAAFFGVAALILLPFAGLGRIQDWSFLRLALPSGMVYSVAFWLYVSALSRAEVSAVAPLSGLNAVFVVILAALVHREPLTAAKAAGAVLVAGGAAALHGGTRRGGLSPGPALQMVAYALLTAMTRMLDKAGASWAPSAGGAYAFCVFAVTAVCQLALLAVTGGLRGLAALVVSRPGLVVAAGACNGGSFLLLVLSLAALPVSVAEPATALSLLVSAAVAAVWLREPVGARLVPTLAVVAGTWLLVQGVAPTALAAP